MLVISGFISFTQNPWKNVKSMLSLEITGLTHSVHRFVHSFVDKEIFPKINRNFLLIIV